MKAWIVSDWTGEWYSLFHASTAGRAKLRAMAEYSIDCEYIDMRAKRLPEMDDKPFTWADCKAAGFEYFDEGDFPYKPSDFHNDCCCDICKGIDNTRS